MAPIDCAIKRQFSSTLISRPPSHWLHPISTGTDTSRISADRLPFVFEGHVARPHPRIEELRRRRHRIRPEIVLWPLRVVGRLERDFDTAVVAEPLEVGMHL